MEIKSESLATRCDICHKADMFNPKTNFCSRCNKSFKKIFDAKDLIWRLQRENDLYMLDPKKIEHTPEQLKKIQLHYKEWRDENYHQYEAELNLFLSRSLHIDVSLIKKCTMYQKLEMYQEVQVDLAKLRYNRKLGLAIGFIILIGSTFFQITPVIPFGIYLTLLYLWRLCFKTHDDKCFEKLDKYWWRDINGDKQMIIDSYKSEN